MTTSDGSVIPDHRAQLLNGRVVVQPRSVVRFLHQRLYMFNVSSFLH